MYYSSPLLYTYQQKYILPVKTKRVSIVGSHVEEYSQ